jgi:hypothetical protein
LSVAHHDRGDHFVAHRREPAGRSVALALLAIVMVGGALRVHLLAVPLDRDEGAFALAGRTILDGGMPYRDVLDHKPPVVFYLYAVAMSVLPVSASGIHTFLALVVLATAVALLLAVRACLGSWRPALWAAFVFAVFSASPAVEGFVASTEMLLLLPLSLDLLLSVAAVQRRSAWIAAAAGVAGALAFWTKATAAIPAIFLLAWMAASAPGCRGAGSERPRRAAVALALGWVAGALAVSFAICAFFSVRSSFAEFYYWSFQHSIEYVRSAALGSGGSILGTSLARLFGGDVLIVTAACASVIHAVRKRRPEALLVAGLLASEVVSVVPGVGYPHYLAQVLPGAALAAGWGIAELAGRFGRRAELRYTLLVGGAILAAHLAATSDLYFRLSPGEISRKLYPGNPFAESEVLGRYLAARTGASDSVLVFGSEPQILVCAGRRNATSFPMVYPLTSSYRRYGEFQRRYWREARANLPKYVLLVDVPTSILWDGVADLRILRDVEGWMDRDYALEAVMTVGPDAALIPVQPGRPLPPAALRNGQRVLIYRATRA